jgi:alkyl hydroperoxide reductase subunit AhpC
MIAKLACLSKCLKLLKLGGSRLKDLNKKINRLRVVIDMRINDTIPDIFVKTDQGEFSLHEWIGGSWAILFSHPKDFTPVCTTEFSVVAQLKDEWANRNTKVIGISVDSVTEHEKWKRDIEFVSKCSANFPIIADADLMVSKAFDMLPAEAYLPDGRTPNNTATVRSVFIIGPDKKLKLSMTYPMSVGRNFAEVVRALDALQISSEKGVATPANWEIGQDVIIPATVSNKDAELKFGAFNTILPYLRKVNLG